MDGAEGIESKVRKRQRASKTPAEFSERQRLPAEEAAARPPAFQDAAKLEPPPRLPTVQPVVRAEPPKRTAKVPPKPRSKAGNNAPAGGKARTKLRAKLHTAVAKQAKKKAAGVDISADNVSANRREAASAGPSQSHKPREPKARAKSVAVSKRRPATRPTITTIDSLETLPPPPTKRVKRAAKSKPKAKAASTSGLGAALKDGPSKRAPRRKAKAKPAPKRNAVASAPQSAENELHRPIAEQKRQLAKARARAAKSEQKEKAKLLKHSAGPKAEDVDADGDQSAANATQSGVKRERKESPAAPAKKRKLGAAATAKQLRPAIVWPSGNRIIKCVPELYNAVVDDVLYQTERIMLEKKERPAEEVAALMQRIKRNWKAILSKRLPVQRQRSHAIIPTVPNEPPRAAAEAEEKAEDQASGPPNVEILPRSHRRQFGRPPEFLPLPAFLSHIVAAPPASAGTSDRMPTAGGDLLGEASSGGGEIESETGELEGDEGVATDIVPRREDFAQWMVGYVDAGAMRRRPNGWRFEMKRGICQAVTSVHAGHEHHPLRPGRSVLVATEGEADPIPGIVLEHRAGGDSIHLRLFADGNPAREESVDISRVSVADEVMASTCQCILDFER